MFSSVKPELDHLIIVFIKEITIIPLKFEIKFNK
jgi:hypothetical protein